MRTCRAARICVVGSSFGAQPTWARRARAAEQRGLTHSCGPTQAPSLRDVLDGEKCPYALIEQVGSPFACNKARHLGSDASADRAVLSVLVLPHAPFGISDSVCWHTARSLSPKVPRARSGCSLQTVPARGGYISGIGSAVLPIRLCAPGRGTLPHSFSISGPAHAAARCDAGPAGRLRQEVSEGPPHIRWGSRVPQGACSCSTSAISLPGHPLKALDTAHPITGGRVRLLHPQMAQEGTRGPRSSTCQAGRSTAWLAPHLSNFPRTAPHPGAPTPPAAARRHPPRRAHAEAGAHPRIQPHHPVRGR